MRYGGSQKFCYQVPVHLQPIVCGREGRPRQRPRALQRFRGCLSRRGRSLATNGAQFPREPFGPPRPRGAQVRQLHDVGREEVALPTHLQGGAGDREARPTDQDQEKRGRCSRRHGDLPQGRRQRQTHHGYDGGQARREAVSRARGAPTRETGVPRRQVAHHGGAGEARARDGQEARRRAPGRLQPPGGRDQEEARPAQASRGQSRLRSFSLVTCSLLLRHDCCLRIRTCKFP